LSVTRRNKWGGRGRKSKLFVVAASNGASFFIKRVPFRVAGAAAADALFSIVNVGLGLAGASAVNACLLASDRRSNIKKKKEGRKSRAGPIKGL